jgi:hypothetical protein
MVSALYCLDDLLWLHYDVDGLRGCNLVVSNSYGPYHYSLIVA